MERATYGFDGANVRVQVEVLPQGDNGRRVAGDLARRGAESQWASPCRSESANVGLDGG